MSTADQIRVAELTGAARHHAKWSPLTADERDAAVAALRELAAGRTCWPRWPGSSKASPRASWTGR
jgi:hypothetical protein